MTQKPTTNLARQRKETKPLSDLPVLNASDWKRLQEGAVKALTGALEERDEANASSSLPELERGRQVLLRAVKQFPVSPGVYRMLDKEGSILYIGKAKNLRNRVTFYTNVGELNYRIRRMVSLVHKVVFTVTRSESDALFLEADLIRTLKPPFNVLLKDSTPFVSISVSKGHPFPRVAKHRGARDPSREDYLGPFSSIKSVNEALLTIQKVFQLRNCPDATFAKRKRPCLQYDIKRCSAPCMGKVSEEEYQAAVQGSKEFLAGKLVHVRDALKERMAAASEALNFEQAARYRDTIRRLEKLPLFAKNATGNLVNADVIAIFQSHPDVLAKLSAGPLEGEALPCIQVLFIRNSLYLGGDTFFLNKNVNHNSPEENIASFIQQFYLNRKPPDRLLVNFLPLDAPILQDALKQRYSQALQILCPQRGVGMNWVLQAFENARQQSQYEASKNASFADNLAELARVFVLPGVPHRVEIYDNSHIQGVYAYGCMVVATPDGFDKKAYRQFSVAPHKAGDLSAKGGSDFAMMEEMMARRFRNAHEAEPGTLPDLMIIDGGAGQVSSVLKILEAYDLSISVVGIAKGPDRNAGRERFFVPGWAPFSLPEHDPTLHFIQRLRDEAHRFAIGTHRQARSKGFTKSQLSEIPGIGDVRKRLLMKTFGSVQGVRQASLQDLLNVEGLGSHAAEAVYRFFHEESSVG